MKRKKIRRLRTISQVCVIVVVCVGLAVHTGLGTPSSFGWDWFATICPLGWLQTMMTGTMPAPLSFVCIALTVALIVLFGRAFCGWVCPTPLIRRIFGGEKSVEKDTSPLKDCDLSECRACGASCSVAHMVEHMNASVASPSSNTQAGTSQGVNGKHAGTLQASNDKSKKQDFAKSRKSCADNSRRHIAIKSSPADIRHAVAVSALIAAAVFAFPVFCLVCPVGLTIAEIIVLWRFFTLGIPTFSMMLYPAILVVELVVFKRWCHVICPISALVSLVSKANHTFRPIVNKDTCLRETGKSSCHKCFHACPESIDLHQLAYGAPVNECMKCHECAAVCPTNSITFPLYVPKKDLKDQSLVRIKTTEQ